MKNFNKSGTCNTDDLEQLLVELLDCVKMANFINRQKPFKNNVNISKLKFSFEDDIYQVEFDYNIEENKFNNDDNEETTFDGFA